MNKKIRASWLALCTLTATTTFAQIQTRAQAHAQSQTQAHAQAQAQAETLVETPIEPGGIDNTVPYTTASTTPWTSSSFITPARMASSIIDSPNSVTSIDTKTLKKLGITEMVDAMRLVPGVMVSETHANDVSVGYHGANVVVPRRSEVLYNSNRLYRPGYAGAHWARLPVDVQDLNFIEVVRGASPEYGSNAMTSTINLVQDSVASRGVYGFTRVGDADTRDVYAKAGVSLGQAQLGLRLLRRQNDGFDGVLGSDRPYTNDLATNSVMVNLETPLGSRWLLDVAGAYAGTRYERPDLEQIPDDGTSESQALAGFRLSPDTDEVSSFLSSKLHGSIDLGTTSNDITLGVNYSHFSREQVISACGPNFSFDPRLAALDALPSIVLSADDFGLAVRAVLTGELEFEASYIQPPSAEELQAVTEAGPYFQSIGFTLFDEICGDTDQDLDEDRFEFNGVLVSQLTDRLENALSLTATKNRITAQTFLGGTVDQDAVQITDTVRYRWNDQLTVSGTVAFESSDNVDSDNALSYRAAMNYQFRPGWVVRFTQSRAERLPDVYETDRDWTFRFSYEDGTVDHLGRTEGTLLRRAVSPDTLTRERLDSTEVAVAYSVFDSITADFKVFYEDFSNLISEPFNFFDFRLTNDGELTNQGFEIGLRHSRRSGIDWGASYAYLDSDTDTAFENTLRSQHTGSVWAIFPVGTNTDLAGVYYGASSIGQSAYDRFDITVTHRRPMNRGNLDLQLNFRRYPNSINAFTEISDRIPNASLIEGRNRLFLTAALSFY
ncbi:MAG: TonB-dependent receptor [Pseudomonadota bacterium]